MQKLLLCLSWVLLAFTALAQAPEPKEYLSKPFIEVSGTSEMEVVPDEIYISITLQERIENREKLTIEKQEEQLKQVLTELGIELSNLSLKNADADYRRYKVLKNDVIVSKYYILKINSAEVLGKVYEKLDKLNVFDAYVLKISHSKLIQFQKENRINAIKAAKEKVEVLLTAIGKQAGSPLQIIETSNYVDGSVANKAYGAYSRSVQFSNSKLIEDSDKESEISFRKIKITSSFLVKYEILNK